MSATTRSICKVVRQTACSATKKNELDIAIRFLAERAKLADRRRSAGPLILAPTRESAIQIARDAQKLTTHQRDLEVQLLVGGAGKDQQVKDWMVSSRDIVVATPGRLRDLLTNQLEFRHGLKGCPMLILDEADALLSMGFRDDIDAIVSFLSPPPVRQTILFSATMSRAVRQLASRLSPNPIFIDAAPPEPASTPRRDEEYATHTKPAISDTLPPHSSFEQFCTRCPAPLDQIATLLKLLVHDRLTYGLKSKVIVFCPTVQATELFSTLLPLLAEEVLPNGTTEFVTTHSKLKQSDRDRALLSFRKVGTASVLVTSDISARGVDYTGVTRIIQIGIPSKEHVYIQRTRKIAQSIQSFVSGRETEDYRPSVHSHLLLLPWEAGYMDWHLTNLPIKPLPMSVLDGQLASLSSVQPPVPTTEYLRSAIQRHIDPAEVRNAAASLLGYYLPLVPSLRLQPDAILEGVSSWASECFNVSIPRLKRFPRKFVDAYEESLQSERTKGLFVDGLKISGASSLGKAKSKNRSVWEGMNTRKRVPKRWH